MSDQAERWEGEWGELRSTINALMLDLGYGVEDLADAANLSRETVRPIMNGVPGNYRPATLAKISKALGLEADFLGKVVAGERTTMDVLVDRLDTAVSDLKQRKADRMEQTDLNSRVAALDPVDQRYVDGVIDALERKKRGD